MAWWGWIVIGAAAVMLIIDCVIIGGKDPRKWKGAGRNDTGRSTDRKV